MQKFIAVAKEAAQKAGALQRDKRGHVESIEFKGDINLVTEVDHACETIILDILQQNFPDHQILTEEAGGIENESSYKWIVDPLDGTTNFAHSYPCHCVSIALEHEERVVLGVIYDPNRDELFEAIRGNGATLNGQKIQVSQNDSLKRSLLATGFAYDVHEACDNNLDHFADFILTSQAVRRDGAAAIDLAYVACGRYDGFWEMGLYAWDVAAGALLVTEAGGTVSMLDGDSLDIYGRRIVASNGQIHQEMLDTLAKKR